ncbi:MAG: thioredoxin domain-containing protein [Cyanobacteria bacterium J06627_28]
MTVLPLRHTRRWIAASVLALTLVPLAACSSAQQELAQQEVEADPATDVVPEAGAVQEPTAAERAEFEAQMAKLNEVIGSMDRAELIGDSATKGPVDADVVLFKFSDFECPFCAIASADMKTFTENHEDDVLYVYKHFPLVSIHDEAMPAAKATWAAAQQDKFWIYHDGLFAYQDKLGEDYYVELAEQVGLDVERFNRDRNSSEAQAAIDKDVELARALELGGTPSFLMTNFSDSFMLPGGAPQELYDEAALRLQNALAN